MGPPPRVSLLYHNFLLVATVHEQQQEGCDGKEYTIHDTKGETGLEHGTRLVEVYSKGTLNIGTI